MKANDPTTVYLKVARSALRSGLKTDRMIASKALKEALKNDPVMTPFQYGILTEIMEMLKHNEKSQGDKAK